MRDRRLRWCILFRFIRGRPRQAPGPFPTPTLPRSRRSIHGQHDSGVPSPWPPNPPRRRNQPRAVQARKSIQPGNVVILLSGRHRGRRVVVLKNLPSGNLLVTGPYALNGVPLKRVNSAYVIATSTNISLNGVAANVDDAFFKKQVKFTKNQLKNASETRNKKCNSSPSKP